MSPLSFYCYECSTFGRLMSTLMKSITVYSYHGTVWMQGTVKLCYIWPQCWQVTVDITFVIRNSLTCYRLRSVTWLTYWWNWIWKWKLNQYITYGNRIWIRKSRYLRYTDVTLDLLHSTDVLTITQQVLMSYKFKLFKNFGISTNTAIVCSYAAYIIATI